MARHLDHPSLGNPLLALSHYHVSVGLEPRRSAGFRLGVVSIGCFARHHEVGSDCPQSPRRVPGFETNGRCADASGTPKEEASEAASPQSELNQLADLRDKGILTDSVALLPFATHLEQAYVLIFLSSLPMPGSQLVRSAALLSVTGIELFMRGSSLDIAALSIAGVIDPVLGGWLLGVLGARSTFFIVARSLLLAAVLAHALTRGLGILSRRPPAPTTA